MCWKKKKTIHLSGVFSLHYFTDNQITHGRLNVFFVCLFYTTSSCEHWSPPFLLTVSSTWLPILCVCACKCLCTRHQTYPFRFLIWEDAALSTCCEVAVNLEGVPRAALVWINPVLTCRNGEREKTQRGGEQLQSGMYDLKPIRYSFRSRQSLTLYGLC